MKSIKLTQNKVALIDDEDFERVNKYKWYFKNPGYACNESVGLLHRFIMSTPKNMEVDHINHNKLDNTKQNLRNCSVQENHYNTTIHKTNKTGFKGVSYHKRTRKFESRIRVNKIKIHLGLFKDKILAAIAYNNAAIKYHGQYAKLNLF